MSGRGNCYDTAQAESFFSRFKVELVEDGIFEDAATARSESFSYIEGSSNRVRSHSSLGYKSPMEYEKELKTKKERRTSESFVSCSTWPPQLKEKNLISEQEYKQRRQKILDEI